MFDPNAFQMGSEIDDALAKAAEAANAAKQGLSLTAIFASNNPLRAAAVTEARRVGNALLGVVGKNGR